MVKRKELKLRRLAIRISRMNMRSSGIVSKHYTWYRCEKQTLASPIYPLDRRVSAIIFKSTSNWQDSAMITAAQRQRSFERRRPHIPPPVQPPNQRARMNGTGGRRRPRPLSPQSPGYDPEYAYFPPAPEVPLSPTTTNTTTTHSSSAGSTSSMHWVSRLFDQHRSTTAFRKQGQR